MRPDEFPWIAPRHVGNNENLVEKQCNMERNRGVFSEYSVYWGQRTRAAARRSSSERPCPAGRGTVGKKKLTENLYVQPGSGSRPNLYFSSTDRDPQPCLKHIPAPLGEEPGFTGKGSEGPDPEPAPERETKHGPNRPFLAGRGSVPDTGWNSLDPGPGLKKNEPESERKPILCRSMLNSKFTDSWYKAYIIMLTDTSGLGSEIWFT